VIRPWQQEVQQYERSKNGTVKVGPDTKEIRHDSLMTPPFTQETRVYNAFDDI